MDRSKDRSNKDLVLKAFGTLFNHRDHSSAETFWSPRYIQHSAHIEPGRDGLLPSAECSRYVALRARFDLGRIGLGNFSGSIQWLWPACKLDCH